MQNLPQPSSRSATNLLIRNANLVALSSLDATAKPPTTPPPATLLPVRGEAMAAAVVPTLADVLILGNSISKVLPIRVGKTGKRLGEQLSIDRLPPNTNELDAQGRAVVPGFIDCHTHSCFAGQRFDEWDKKRKGVPYLKILAQGGGIMSTVRAVRESSQDQLAENLLARAFRMLEQGSTTIEVKSGYGLTTEHELKMLRAIAQAQLHFPGTLVPTALLGHAIDPDVPGFIGRVIRETLPAIHAEFPNAAVDVYVEKESWSVEQALLLLARARDLGHPLRAHVDQFTSLGMLPASIKLNARSVDHLEASSKEDLLTLASSNTVGVMLPGCGFHLDNRYAKGRSFIIAGGALAIATNCNPGSSPCESMQFIQALAVRELGLAPEEALCASTINPACVLNLSDRSIIAPGKRADLLILNSSDFREISCSFGTNSVRTVIVNGQVHNAS